jgi:hypothetical protein
MRFMRRCAGVMTLVLAGAVCANANCSATSLTGNFGYTLSGLDASFFFTASVGLLTMDGKGGITGTVTISDDGVITNAVAATGSYVLNTTCSGTMTITPSGGSTQFFAVYVDAKNKRFEMTQTNAGFTVSGYALAQGVVTCTLAGVRAVYYYSGGGWQTSPSLYPVAISGVVNADGLGNLQGTQTASAAGVILTGSTSGTYTVNPDCTGTTTSTNSLGQTSHSNVVLVNNGRTTFQIATDAGAISVNVGQKQ